MNVRELIPRVRRAIEGVGTTADPLSDDEVLAVTADAISNIIFFTNGRWGHALNVLDRDGTTNAPTEWELVPDLNPAEETVIVAQAALDHFFHVLRTLKTQETIRNEGSEWTYSYSANALSEQLKMLRDARDEALDILSGVKEGIVARYQSFIAVRDSAVSAVIEPWVNGGVGGQEFSGRGLLDR